MARPGAERGWTDTQRRHDHPLRKRTEGRTDASGPDMWVDDQPTSATAKEPRRA